MIIWITNSHNHQKRPLLISKKSKFEFNLLESRNVEYISEASPVYIQKLKEEKIGDEYIVCQTARAESVN